MQSDLKFDLHMALKKDKALKPLGAIKRILIKPHKKAGYWLALACVAQWDPTLVKEIELLEILQHRSVWFIARLRGRESVTEACSEQPLKQSLRNHRLSLLMKVVQDEQWHSTLLVACDEITGDRQKVTRTTRSVACGEMASVYVASHVYHGSFLSRVIRCIRENTD